MFFFMSVVHERFVCVSVSSVRMAVLHCVLSWVCYLEEENGEHDCNVLDVLCIRAIKHYIKTCEQTQSITVNIILEQWDLIIYNIM